MFNFCLKLFFISILSLESESKFCHKTVQETYIVSVPQTYRKMFKVKTKYVAQTQYRNVTIEECCSGYAKLENDCVPLCDSTCVHGNCTAPNECTCNEGFVSKNKYTCTPKCDNCNNGFCSAPNVCNCFSNYIKNDNGICVPDCIQECKNGYCSSPDTCSCNAGYKMREDEVSDLEWCEPQCSKSCENGFCSEPETCKCNKGFELNLSGQCESMMFETTESHSDYTEAPALSEITDLNSVNLDESTVASNNATCPMGLTHDNDTESCVSLCDAQCINGTCIARNQCQCNEGLVMDSNNPYFCFEDKLVASLSQSKISNTFLVLLISLSIITLLLLAVLYKFRTKIFCQMSGNGSSLDGIEEHPLKLSRTNLSKL